MHEPHHFVWVRHDVGGEFGADHLIHSHIVYVGQLEQPPHQCALQGMLDGMPHKWQADNIGRVPVFAEGIAQPFGEVLGTTTHEGHLWCADQDALGHGASSCAGSCW